MMEAWLERQIMSAKPRKRRRMVRDLYAIAEELKALGGISRIRSQNREGERNLAHIRTEASAAFRAFADLFSRRIMDAD